MADFLVSVNKREFVAVSEDFFIVGCGSASWQQQALPWLFSRSSSIFSPHTYMFPQISLDELLASESG